MSVVLVDSSVPTLDDVVAQQRDRLLDRLRLQRAHAVPLWAWYSGKQPFADVDRRYKPAYKLLLELSRTPWARLVVDAIAERLHVQGFRSSQNAAATDTQAWQLFVDSSLDADEWLVYTEALITGVGYASVTKPDGASSAAIAPESVFEVTHEPVPGSRRDVAAALKLYPVDWSGSLWAVELYRPDATFRWLAELSRPVELDTFPIDKADAASTIKWEPDDPFEVANTTGVVPMIPFENRATVLGGGVSEIEDCIPILRRIDKLTLDKLLTSEFAAFRQKWATGLQVPEDEHGNPIEPYNAAVTKVWVSDSPDTRFGSFDASDLGPYLQAIDSEIAALAAISRVPAHYLIQTSLANPPSAESLIAGESGLVAKIVERQRRFGEAWERTLRLALDVSGQSVDRLDVVWKDAEMRNPAQVADAAVKLQTIGVPQEALWEYVGATPQQVSAWSLEAAAAELTTPPAGDGAPS